MIDRVATYLVIHIKGYLDLDDTNSFYVNLLIFSIQLSVAPEDCMIFYQSKLYVILPHGDM